MALAEQVGADQDDTDGDQLLYKLRGIDGKGRNALDLLVGCRAVDGQVAPALEQQAFGPEALDGFRGVDGLDQHRLAKRRFIGRSRDPAADERLRHQADDDHGNQRHGRHVGQRSADHVDHGDEDEHETRVDHRRYGVGGEKLTYEFVLRHPGDIFAGRHRARGKRCVHHLLKQDVGNLQVNLPPGVVNQRGAGELEQKIEQERNADAGSEHPQRRDRLVRQDPVIDIHDEERRCQSQYVDEECSKTDTHKGAPIGADSRRQPMLLFNFPGMQSAGLFLIVEVDLGKIEHSRIEVCRPVTKIYTLRALCADSLLADESSIFIDGENRDECAIQRLDQGRQVGVATEQIGQMHFRDIKPDTARDFAHRFDVSGLKLVVGYPRIQYGRRTATLEVNAYLPESFVEVHHCSPFEIATP